MIKCNKKIVGKKVNDNEKEEYLDQLLIRLRFCFTNLGWIIPKISGVCHLANKFFLTN